jgi:hypothetical protein
MTMNNYIEALTIWHYLLLFFYILDNVFLILTKKSKVTVTTYYYTLQKNYGFKQFGYIKLIYFFIVFSEPSSVSSTHGLNIIVFVYGAVTVHYIYQFLRLRIKERFFA